jgi:hypothetical protein
MRGSPFAILPDSALPMPPTDDMKLGNIDVTSMLRRAFETIPQVVDHAFHNALD